MSCKYKPAGCPRVAANGEPPRVTPDLKNLFWEISAIQSKKGKGSLVPAHWGADSRSTRIQNALFELVSKVCDLSSSFHLREKQLFAEDLARCFVRILELADSIGDQIPFEDHIEGVLEDMRLPPH